MPVPSLRPIGGPTPQPFHAILVAGSLVLFLGGLLADWAYANSYEIQWTNFASWLVAAASFLCGIAAIFALVELIRSRFATLIYAALLAFSLVLGVVNSFVHAKDAWAAMPAALILSVISTIVMTIATWALFSRFRTTSGTAHRTTIGKGVTA